VIRAVALVVLATRIALAEPMTTDAIAAQVQFGVTDAPFDVTPLPAAKGQAFVFTLAGSYAPAPRLTLGAHAPVVLASVAQPAGSYVDSTTLGNPQLRAAMRWFDESSGDARLAIASGVELGIPLAGHSPNLVENRALAIANGIAGLAAPELFTPGVVPITAFAEAGWSSGRWRIDATLRIPLLLRFSDADLPAETSTPRTVGIASVVGAEARRQLTKRLAVAAGAQVALELAPSVEHVRNISRWQDLERVGLGIRLARSASLLIEAQGALGGPVGGSTLALGVRAVLLLP